MRNEWTDDELTALELYIVKFNDKTNPSNTRVYAQGFICGLQFDRRPIYVFDFDNCKFVKPNEIIDDE